MSFPSWSPGTETQTGRVLSGRRIGPDVDRARRPAHGSGPLPRRHRRRGDLPETRAAEAPRLSARPARRRPRWARTADALKVTHPSAIVWAAQMGTHHPHPWQVRCPGHRAPRRACLSNSSTRSPAPLFGRPRDARGGCAQTVARRARARGLPEDLRWARRAHLLADQTDWDFVAVRRAGIALAREVQRRVPEAVTTSWWKEERGKTNLHRLQPERPRPHLRLGVFGAKDPDRDGVDPAELDDCATPPPTTTPSRRCPISLQPGRIRGPTSIRWPSRSSRFWTWFAPTNRSAASELRGIRRAIRRCPASRPCVQPSKRVAANWDDEGNRDLARLEQVDLSHIGDGGRKN